MTEPFTIRIYVPDGDPEGLRIIDRMNWTGLGIVVPREEWTKVRMRSDFAKPGVYILMGYVTDDEEDDLPKIYIGQADSIRTRIDQQLQAKDFWNRAIIFVSASGGLNRAHATWLEYALVKHAIEAGRSHLENGNEPAEPSLSEAEKADTQAFLREMLQILPLVGLNAFDAPKAVASPMVRSTDIRSVRESEEPDTIIVPAKKDGFERVFMGQNAWWAIRISGGMLSKVKYIAAYQSQPVSAITHLAPVERIEPYGDSGKYKLVFSERAKPFGPIPFGDAPSGSMQGPRYTTLAKLRNAKKISDIF